MQTGDIFPRLMDEHGNLEKTQNEDEEQQVIGEGIKPSDLTAPLPKTDEKTMGLMHEEERFVGAVTWTVYRDWMRAAGSSFFWAMMILVLLVLYQSSQGPFSIFSMVIPDG